MKLRWTERTYGSSVCNLHQIRISACDQRGYSERERHSSGHEELSFSYSRGGCSRQTKDKPTKYCSENKCGKHVIIFAWSLHCFGSVLKAGFLSCHEYESEQCQQSKHALHIQRGHLGTTEVPGMFLPQCCIVHP